MTAQLPHRARDPAPRDFRRPELLGGAQDDQILKGEEPRATRTAIGVHESRLDQRANRTARQTQQLFHIAHAVVAHGARRGYFFAAFLCAGSAGCARLAGLRVSAGAALAGVAVFLPRLARSASMRSMTWAPASGASATVISWPSTFF